MKCPLCHGSGHVLDVPSEDDLRFAGALGRMEQRIETIKKLADEVQAALRAVEEEPNDA